MRLLQLDLIAFGPFSGLTLDFKATHQRPGLHVVYGPNEAGKSSTLRALRAALFGFPVQTSDDFVHPYAKLRVGATLEGQEGRSLSFVRRKGAKNTLLSADGQTPLPDDALHPFLGSAKEDDFFSMFAIGHNELRTGGQEILKGQGQLSELLFMTAGGLPRLRRVERSFNDEADALFKPRGEKPPINEALLRIKELRSLQKEKSLLAADYLRHTEALAKAKTERRAVEDKLAELRVQKSRLERLSLALPTAARLKQFQTALAAIGDAPRLPADFTAKRESVEREARSLSGRIEQLQADLQRTEQQFSTLTVPTELLTAGVEIERLFKRLGSHEKAMADAQDRRAEVAQLEADARSLLRSIRPELNLDDVESLRLTRQEQATIRELAARGRELYLATRKHEQDIERLNERISRASVELERLGAATSSEILREAVKRASREGDLEGALNAAGAEAVDLARRIERGLAALPSWKGEVDDLIRLPVPPLATIERFEREFDLLEQETRRLRDAKTSTERSLRKAERDQAEIRRDGAVPSEESLREARGHRDQGWREVRRELEGLGPGPDRQAFLGGSNTDSLPQAFEAAMKHSDDVADRLRRQAERVERLNRLQRDLDEHQIELERLDTSEAELKSRRDELVAEWSRQWSFLESPPLTPREMRDWLTRHAELVRLAEERRAATGKAEEVRTRLDAHREALTTALSECGSSPKTSASMSSLLDLAERTLADQDAAAEARRGAAAERERSVHDLRETEIIAEADRKEFAALKGDWSSWMARLGLAADAKSDAALAVLDTLADVFEKLDAVAGLKQRIGAIADDARDFGNDVRSAAERLLPEMASRPVEETASALHNRLIEARSLQDRHEELVRRRDALARDLQEGMHRSAELNRELSSLCAEAGCDDAAELPAIEKRAAERRRVESQIEQAEGELQQRSGGRSVAEFLLEIDKANPDRIELDREAVTKHENELNDRRVDLAEVITQHEQELGRMTGGAEAVTAAEDAQAVVARLVNQVERYAKLRFAAKLLKDGRENYRQKTGNTVLDRAGELFATLTRSSFKGLAVDYGDSDEPLLAGIRGDGQTVRAEGMSDGTADQLYLALRLAGLSAWLDSHDPLPFIVDDILVHFDDARSSAALAALSSLATQTQVILFTHHAHVRELALETVPRELLHLHEIGAARVTNEVAVNGEAAEPVKANGRSKRSLF